jgi:N-acyl-D-aspartate/D-glutamate deacylase
MTWDLVIRGGIVVDGTGLSRRRADVAVKDDRIAAVGHVQDAKDADRVIDAEGMIVAPGIIDLHTHYDPQLTFDPYATSSCYHGVPIVLDGKLQAALPGQLVHPVGTQASS